MSLHFLHSSTTRSAARREQSENTIDADSRADALVIDHNHFQVRMGRRAVKLTCLEFDLLYYLITHADHVVGQDELLRQVVRSAQTPGGSLLRVHIHRLRMKLGEAAAAIQTIRGRGFWFDRERVIGGVYIMPDTGRERGGRQE